MRESDPLAYAPTDRAATEARHDSLQAAEAASRARASGLLLKLGVWLGLLWLALLLANNPPLADTKRILVFLPGSSQAEMLDRVVALGGLPLGETGRPQAKLVAFDRPVGRLELLAQGVVLSFPSDARGCITLPEPAAQPSS